jgi:hypothetical protein
MFLNTYVGCLHKSLVLVTSRKLINDIGIHSALVISIFGLWGHLYCHAFSLDPHTIPGLTIQVKFLHCSFKQATNFLLLGSSIISFHCQMLASHSILSTIQPPDPWLKILGCVRGYRRRIVFFFHKGPLPISVSLTHIDMNIMQGFVCFGIP